ncbi:hypothetical protein VNI00_018734 [Paramarasmius palmivorus]|uniref:BZIP domain-containing protein n=1 Tax=Paramarasmius palmivorus TaxID=297713 RepID=A0AAW0AVT2_9AGAR
MSSRRGRKRNDDLPPNRVRDAQRAFRAQKAAYLQELERKVSDLQKENKTLRFALQLPLDGSAAAINSIMQRR